MAGDNSTGPADSGDGPATWIAWQPQSNAAKRLSPAKNSAKLRDLGTLVIRPILKPKLIKEHRAFEECRLETSLVHLACSSTRRNAASLSDWDEGRNSNLATGIESDCSEEGSESCS